MELSGAKLPKDAQAKLDEISRQKGWQKRELVEEDYFWMWMSDIRAGPIGDPTAIHGAPTEKKIELAEHLERTDAFNQTDVWRVYSKSDPRGALEAVMSAGSVGNHISRWEDVLRAISQIGAADDRTKQLGKELTIRAFDALQDQTDAILERLCRPLDDLYANAIDITARVPYSWWDRLWKFAATVASGIVSMSNDEEPGYALLSRAINSPSGILTRLPIKKLGPSWKTLTETERRRVREQLRVGIACSAIGGSYSRAIITESVAWVYGSTPRLVGLLHRALMARTPEGQALRSILVGISRYVGPELRFRLRRPMLDGVAEHVGTSVSAGSMPLTKPLG